MEDVGGGFHFLSPSMVVMVSVLLPRGFRSTAIGQLRFPPPTGQSMGGVAEAEGGFHCFFAALS